MADLATMLWKELAEFAGNRRYLRVFFIAVLIMGLLPALEGRASHTAAAVLALGLIYAVLSPVIVVAQTAPDLVLRERSSRTLEYLLSTRLPDGAIFGGKILLAAGLGYVSALVTVAVQIVADNLLSGGGTWSWQYLAIPQGRLFVLLATALLAIYLATLGTFVALRVGDQRSAYLVTLLGLGVLVLPFVLHLLTFHLAMSWLWPATGVFALLVAAVVVSGFRLFRREMLVLYLQE